MTPRPTRDDPAVEPEVAAGILDGLAAFGRDQLRAGLLANAADGVELRRALAALAAELRAGTLAPEARDWLADRLDAAARSRRPRDVPLMPPRSRGKRATDDPDVLLGIAMRVAGALARGTGTRAGPHTIEAAIDAVARGAPVRVEVEGEPVRTYQPRPIPREKVARAWKRFGSTVGAAMRSGYSAE